MGVVQLISFSEEYPVITKTKKNMRLSLKLLILFAIFVACFELSNAKRGGGGGRGSRGGGSRGWGGGSVSRGSSSRVSSSRSRSYSYPGGSYKSYKKKKALSTLKKVAVVGAVAYGAYQIGKMTSRFGSYGWGNNYPGYNFNTWNSWRQADGFLCRNDNDCTSSDDNLECQKVGNFGWNVNPGWFNGEKPVGECGCDDGFEWDDDDLQCEVRWGRVGGWLGMGLVGFIIFILVAACCCCGICCFAVKKFMSRKS